MYAWISIKQPGRDVTILISTLGNFSFTVYIIGIILKNRKKFLMTLFVQIL